MRNVHFGIVPALVLGAASACAATAPPPPAPAPNVYRVLPAEAASAPADSTSTLQVSGTGEVRVPADRARLSFAVETEDSTAEGASDENARRMDATLRALRGLDVEGVSIETGGYSLQPRYRTRATRDGSVREIVGYTARNLVEVTVPDPQAVGRLIDAAVEAGANRVESLVFEASDTEEARLQALRQAVAQARSQAEAVAEAMGARLGPALEVHTSAGTPRPMRVQFEAAAMAAPRTPVEPGEQTVNATVTIQYRLEGT